MNWLHEIRESVRREQPLIHCITNPISINQCANAILAVGARPMMAEHPAEVREIAETAGALMLNLGNISDVRMESMKEAFCAAGQAGVNVIVDAVGVACSSIRRRYLEELLACGTPAVIKGNYSEIYAIYRREYRSSGVDAETAMDDKTVSRAAAELARRRRTTILASGKTDIVTDGKRMIRIYNGTPQLSGITGTGCMLGALCGAYLSVCPGMRAAAAACAVLGICGQMAGTEKGSGSFMVSLMDALNTLSREELKKYIDWEEEETDEI